MIKANGGRYPAAGDATTFVGEPPKSRGAIFVFDDLQQIQTWLNSPEYKELKKVLNYGDSALNSSSSFIEIVRRPVSDGLHRENDRFRRRWRIPKWRARRDSNS
jgi:uncharacterized protein (DUF1330 family)